MLKKNVNVFLNVNHLKSKATNFLKTFKYHTFDKYTILKCEKYISTPVTRQFIETAQGENMGSQFFRVVI